MSKSSCRKTRLAAATLLAFGLIACSDTAGPPGENAVGVYLLQSINARPMPYDLGALYNYQLEYTSSTLTIASDQSFHERAIITERLDGSIVQVDTSDFFGHWLQHQASILLIDAETSDTLKATLKNGLLSYDLSQDTAVFHFVYQKQ